MTLETLREQIALQIEKYDSANLLTKSTMAGGLSDILEKDRDLLDEIFPNFSELLSKLHSEYYNHYGEHAYISEVFHDFLKKIDEAILSVQ